MTIHVLGAMPEEVQAFKSGRCKVHVTGVGKTNAAITGTNMWWSALGAHKNSVLCFFVGTAAACDPKLQIGDVVLSTDTLHHDVDVTSLGFLPGQIPFEKEWIWKSNDSLHASAKCACERLGIRHVSGRMITGDQFVSDPAHVTKLHQTFGASCIDMETASFAQALLNAPQVITPWLGIRIISDKADKSAPVDFASFLPQASTILARVVEVLALNVEMQRLRWRS